MNDLIKGSVLEFFDAQFAALTPLSVVRALVLGFLAGVIIALVYRRTFRGVLFSNNFSITLVLLTMITTPVVMCIGSNIALSMGMVGALSIVRFRTAVKDPLDTAYMFWALTMGIILGAGLYLIAFVVVATIALVMLLISFMHLSGPNTFLLVLHYDEAATPAIEGALARIKNRRLRSKTVTHSGSEMTVEVRLGSRQDIIGQMLDIEGVYDATLVACQNEASN